MINVQLSPTKLILCDWQGKGFSIKHPEEMINEISNINQQSQINIIRNQSESFGTVV